MGGIEGGVGADHFRLDPQAEQQPHLPHFADQFSQGAAQFLFVHLPVAQAAGVVAALAEPAVVQHQHLDPQLFGLAGDVQDALAVKVHVGGFPVVDEDGPGLVPPDAADDVVLQKVVVAGRKLAQAGVAVAEQHLRRGELAARLQGPAEIVVADAGHQPGGLHLGDFALDLEAARPDQHGPQALAGLLGGVRRGQDGKGIVLVAGSAPGRPQSLDAVAQGRTLGQALHAVAALEVDQLPLPKGQVQTGRGGLVQPDGPAALVFKQGAAGDDVGAVKDAVQQRDGQAVHLVFQLEA